MHGCKNVWRFVDMKSRMYCWISIFSERIDLTVIKEHQTWFYAVLLSILYQNWYLKQMCLVVVVYIILLRIGSCRRCFLWLYTQIEINIFVFLTSITDSASWMRDSKVGCFFHTTNHSHMFDTMGTKEPLVNGERDGSNHTAFATRLQHHRPWLLPINSRCFLRG